MTIIAQTKTETSNDIYELFKIVEVEDVEGNKVNIKKSIGTYTIDRLNRDKERFNSQIDEIEEKITAINNI